jgi:hypothetical protein
MKKTTLIMFAVNVLLLASTFVRANEPIPPSLPLGGAQFENWKGLETSNDGGAILKLPGEAVFRYPAGPKGWHVVGFTNQNDGTGDWYGYYGLQMDVQVPEGRIWAVDATLKTPPPALRQDFLPESHGVCRVEGKTGWQQVTLPWAVFDFNKGVSGMLHVIQELRLSGKFGDNSAGQVRMKNIRLIQAPTLALKADVQGQAGQLGDTVRYDVTVANCTDAAQEVTLNFEKAGWETMSASIEPAHLTLAPNSTAKCKVSVKLPQDGVPAGGHERQRLQALATRGGEPLAMLDLTTARDVERPSILLTAPAWADVRAKVTKYDWAKKAQDDYVKSADAWQVPKSALASPVVSSSNEHAYVFDSKSVDTLPNIVIAWQLTHNKAYAEKIALFLRRLSDEKTGYPAALRSINAGEPQEGSSFQKIAIAYDAILNSGTLTDEDKRAINHTLRIFMGTSDSILTMGNIGNFHVATNTAYLFCALCLGDISAAERYLYGPGGFTDFVTKGIMDDGWWWECSTSYNFWVASELTQCGLACQPWGIDLLNKEFPANFSANATIIPWGLKPQFGMSFEKWGPNHRNTRSIKQLWDAALLTGDYRGITFGMNDGHEEPVGGSRLELGYYAFRDPRYAALLKLGGQRDLVYGVPELPETTVKPYLDSCYAENIGYALLRSQTEKREPKDQIQAVAKIGSLGGYHGHFDRVSLDNITRYGRSPWNPESIWWGYSNYMYKFFVQTSVAHNMVVVDQKQQEAVPSSQPLFFSGTMMQVVAQESAARWSDPAFLGLPFSPGVTPELQMRTNKQSIPLVTDCKVGELGPFSDRVMQRRLSIVTDDYVVIADYVKSEKPHTFDNLLQLKGFTALEAQNKKRIRHDAQFNADPHSSAQFITDCDWYQASAPAVGHFVSKFGPRDKEKVFPPQYYEDGTLKVDVHSLWPKQQEIMVATPPENLRGQQWVSYEVTGDGKSIAKGESGVWILGAVDIDLPVEGITELTLSVVTETGGKTKSLFWANPHLVTADGTEIPVSGPQSSDNVDMPSSPGLNYYGTPIKIAGMAYSSALPTQPLNGKNPAVIRIPLVGKNAVRFKAKLGGDYYFGPEDQRRKVFAVRTQGKEARFLTVLEPYEDQSAVKSAKAVSADKLRVELADGRVQEITFCNFEGDAKDISAEIIESKDGKILRSESTPAR